MLHIGPKYIGDGFAGRVAGPAAGGAAGAVIPFVPSIVSLFRMGGNVDEQAAKFGVTPAQLRQYMLWWLNGKNRGTPNPLEGIIDNDGKPVARTPQGNTSLPLPTSSFLPGTTQSNPGYKYGLSFEDWLRLGGMVGDEVLSPNSGSTGNAGNTRNEPNSGTNSGTMDPSNPDWQGALDPRTGASNGGSRGYAETLMEWALPLAGLFQVGYDLTAGANAVRDGAQIQADAAREAARLDREAAAEATQLARDMFDRTREDAMPHIQAGNRSVNRLSHLMGLQQDPTAAEAVTAMPYRQPQQPRRMLPNGMSFDEAAAMYGRGR